MNKLSRLTALLLALLMLFSSTGLAEAAAGIAFDDFDAAAYFNLKQSASQAATASVETSVEDGPTTKCEGDDECIVDELAKYETAQARYEYFMRLCETDSNAPYYYLHYTNTALTHQESDLLCECLENPYSPSTMLPPGDEGHNANYCPWHPDYGKEPEEEITLKEYTLTTDDESEVYAYIYGKLPVGATLTAKTVENDFGVQDALESVKLTVKTAGGNVWQPESGSYTVVIKSDSLPGTGLATVYLTTGEEGAYETSTYGVTQFTTSGVTLTLSSFGIVTFAEYILQETTEDGTSVTVSGNVPADVQMTATDVDAEDAEMYLPGVNDLNLRYLALDITLSQDGDEWQPGEAVEVTVSAQDLGEDGDNIVVYHNHDGKTKYIGVFTIEDGQLTFALDGFSCVLLLNDNDTVCWVEDLAALETAEERYEYLMTQKQTDEGVYRTYLWHYINTHYNKGVDVDLQCICNKDTIGGDIKEPWIDGHITDCPWHPDNKPAETTQTVNGTTVSVSGGVPEGASLSLAAADLDEVAKYLPFISEISSRFVSLDIELKVGDTQVHPDDEVTVTVSADKIGENDDTVMVVHTHFEGDSYTQSVIGTYTIKDNAVSFNMSQFSNVTIINCDDEIYGSECIIDELTVMTAEQRYQYFTDLTAKVYTQANLYYMHYISVHEREGLDLLCNCCEFPLPYAPGAEHTYDTCPWDASNYVPQTTITNNGLTITGNIPSGSSITVGKVDDLTSIDKISALANIANKKLAYDVTIVNANNAVWQPDDTVSVTMDVSSIGVEGDPVRIYHVHTENDTQTLQMIDAGKISAAGTVTFNVREFSILLAVNMNVDGGTVAAGDPITPPLPVQPEYGDGKYAYADAGTGDLDAGEVSISMPKYGKATLEVAEDGGQWQIALGDMWFNITGETGTTLDVTYVMIKPSVESIGSALIRWVSADYERSSEIAAIYVEEDAAAASEEILMYAAAPLAISNVMPLADELTPSTYSIVINYLFEDNTIAADPYTASLAAGSSFSATVNVPTVQGYLPYVGDEEQTGPIILNYTSIQANETINVVYKPTNVDYTVYHYHQNVDNDEYTLVETETLQGLTGSFIATEVEGKYSNPEVANEYPGFYSLLYEKAEIAADGSTYVEVYYDRYYYLMNFDLVGGYGVEPIYGRFGATVMVGDPIREGYTFGGWDPSVPETIPVNGGTYTAQWIDPQLVNYTVVYWRENADDTNFSFWGSEIKQAVAGTTVSGSDSVPTSVSNAVVDGATVNTKQYFTYLDSRTDKNVVVEGNGSSVVNVYYTRNYYTILFTGYGTCALDEHEHTTACQTLICGVTQEHSHADYGCTYTITCGLEEHTEHTDDCLTCNEPGHTHTAVCYITRNNNNGNNQTCGRNNHPWNPSEGDTYTHNNDGRTCVYHNNGWYRYSYNNSVNTNTCNAHEHDDSCYSDTLHTHNVNCRTYSCGLVDHTHSNSCYQDCSKPEHTHTNNCNTNNSNNVIYVITAKYEQNIADIWPTYDVLQEDGHAYVDNSNNVENANGSRFRGWDIDGVSSEAVSKRVTMTADLCDTSVGTKDAEAQYGATYTYHLYYMFESFDQTSGENDPTRLEYTDDGDTNYYDSSSAYYQELVYTTDTTFGQKPITGMVPIGTEYKASGNGNNRIIYNWLYYNRNRSDLSFQNVDTVVKTVTDIMYDQPLKDYKDGNGNLLSAFTPEYPATLEPGAYVFDGWYTTPECFEGTKFDFSVAKMPNNDLTLYANWEPIDHIVEFYLDYEAMEAETKLGETHPDLSVDHGSKVSEEDMPAEPDNGDYSFVGWFYMDGDVEKAFDFNNMVVNQDLKVYGKWSSNVLKQFYIYYKVQGTNVEIADPTTGSSLAGTTKTFDAKGDLDLYVNYRDGYFPIVQSHSLTLDIENDANNVFTFWYVSTEAVPYTVKYLEAGTNRVLYDEKVVSDNRKAVVTETFEPIAGYMPDAYQKRLVVSAAEGAVNEIIFYYTEDLTHAYYKITHYTQNTDGVNWTEYASSEAIGYINTRYTGVPLTIQGFTYDKIEYVVDGVVMTENITSEGYPLGHDGLEINLYYVRNKYPYIVRYLEQGTSTELAAPKNGAGLYGAVVSEREIDITNYTAVAPTSQTLTIRIDGAVDESGNIVTEPVQNIITFYYVENDATINYEVVGPEGCGTVSPSQETIKVLSGVAAGSTAEASSANYKFVGWYDNKECTGTPISTDLEYIPTKEDGAAWPVTSTYYAKFEWNVTSLKITKKFTGTGVDPDAVAMFKVTGGEGDNAVDLTVAIKGNGSVTIDNLLIGPKYTVEELTGWNWRYKVTPDGGKYENVELSGGEVKEVIFTNEKSTDKWLDDEAYVENHFAGVSPTE